MYLYSLKEAAEWGEKDEWRESYLENCDCARAIERAIDEHYDGQCLKSCAKEIIDRYGFDRVNFVLAATVRQGIHDGRYSEDNKKWSKRFSVMDKENTWQYHVRSHPGLVNLLQKAVMTAIMETANQNTEVLRTLKLHIGMGLEGERSEDNSIDLQVRIAEIDAEFRKMLDRVSTETVEAFDEETATRLMNEKSRLQQQLDNIADAEQRRENAKSRLDDIYTILDGIKNRPMEYNDQIVRQLLEFIVVDSKEQVTVIFKGGLKSVQPLTE